MKKLLTFALSGFLLAPFGFAQDETINPEAEKKALQDNAANPVVQEDLAEPDGVSIAMAEDGSYQIFARGTGVYDFDDEHDRQAALQTATLKAKAALSKYISERLATEEGLDEAIKKANTLTKEGGVTKKNPSQENTSTVVSSIRNSSQALLTGIITLESRRIPGTGDEGTYQVTVGVSSKTIHAAESIANRMADSLSNRHAVTGGAAGTAGGAPAGLRPIGGASGSGNVPEVRKAKTIF